MRKTSPSLPDSYPGLSGSIFIDTSSAGRAGSHPMTRLVIVSPLSMCYIAQSFDWFFTILASSLAGLCATY